MNGLPPLPLQDFIGFLVPSDSLFIDFIWHLLRTMESHCVSGGRSQFADVTFEMAEEQVAAAEKVISAVECYLESKRE